ncbi:unnamed protein product [Didymodactylos carnosus]|uniref:Uncharacterized protein n=1 Tax=Didymodactylos carnosus TaxID=1234261 RepID=A0A8S2DME0_9BILA|nr:unnamed protein product [Didymodactylos carnosus]CAF3708332.1 unnamed protein product [Didymodactylos carnosus]
MDVPDDSGAYEILQVISFTFSNKATSTSSRNIASKHKVEDESLGNRDHTVRALTTNSSAPSLPVMKQENMECETMESERLNTMSNVTSHTSTLIQTHKLYAELKRYHDTLMVLTEGSQTLSNDSSGLSKELSHV